MTVVVSWRPHGSGKWHAWLLDADVSVCGLVGTSDLDGYSYPWPPGRRACQHCRARLRRGEVRPDRVRQLATHIAGMADAGHCACVREWPAAREYVAGAEADLALALFTWEVAGGLWQDVLEAERAVTEAWEQASRRYELLDGSHPHAQRRHP